jgi:hypothetical protein
MAGLNIIEALICLVVGLALIARAQWIGNVSRTWWEQRLRSLGAVSPLGTNWFHAAVVF